MHLSHIFCLYYFSPYFKARETPSCLYTADPAGTVSILVLALGFERGYIPFLFPFLYFITYCHIFQEWEAGCSKHEWLATISRKSVPVFCFSGVGIKRAIFFSLSFSDILRALQQQGCSSITFTFFGNLHFLNNILDFWGILELDLGLNISSILSFIYSFNKYFEDLCWICSRCLMS